MAAFVAWTAAQLEFVHDRSEALFKRRIVVVGEQVMTAAVDTDPVTLVHHPTLARGRVAMATGGVDRPALGIVDQYSKERLRRDSFDQRFRNRCAVIEAAAVGPHVQHDLAGDADSTAPDEGDECVCPLLRKRWPANP
jgi:hypothetical protein